MQKINNKLIYCFIAYCLLLVIAAPASAWSPWGNVQSKAMLNDEVVTSVPEIAGIAGIRAYQRFISPLLASNKCNFNPSCSRYALDAVREVGAGMGAIMAFERLSRDHFWAWEENYPVKDGRLFDPVVQ